MDFVYQTTMYFTVLFLSHQMANAVPLFCVFTFPACKNIDMQH